MYRTVFIVLFLFLLGESIYSQESLLGFVYDKQTGKPIPKVSVYLDGTSFYTETNENGYFSLSVENQITTYLIFRHMGYETIAIINPFSTNLEQIKLTEKSNLLNEVVVEAKEGLTREEKLKMFKEEFLGNTKAGKLCEIMNEDKIRLSFNEKDKILTASAEEAIIIKNIYLGYNITYTIADFRVKYVKGMSLNLEPQTSYVVGFSSFSDTEFVSKKIKSRRRNAYRKSSAFFFETLINGNLRGEGFEIYNGKEEKVDIYRGLSLEDTLSLKKVTVIPKATISYIPQELSVYQPSGVIHIYNPDAGWSRLIFLTDVFWVDQYGVTNAIDKLFFSGSIGSRRVGDMLPLDYKP